MEDNVNELEKVLQEGISSYAGVEPLAGLEERILARVRMTESRRRSMAGWWAAWALGVAALAVGWSVYLRMGRTEPTPVHILSETKTATVSRTPPQIETITVSKRSAHGSLRPTHNDEKPRHDAESLAEPRPQGSVGYPSTVFQGSHRAALPKRLVFPTPSPLSNEERLLLAMMKRDPDGTAQVFDSLRKRGSEPLEIAPLVIPPLETGGGQ